MNNPTTFRSRNRRNILQLPIKFSLSNYSMDAHSKAMKDPFAETLLLNNINKLHLISDPLKKNLADSVITASSMEKAKEYEAEKPPQRNESQAPLSGITNFFSGVFNIMSAVFQKRASSPVSQYYDCFDFEDEKQMSPSLAWHSAKLEVQNKNEQVEQCSCNNSTINSSTSMTTCRDVVSNCEDKLNQVRMLLKDKKPQQLCKRRPRRVFVEPGSVTDSFEDAFCPDDFVNLPDNTFFECYGAYNHQEQDLFETDAPFVKTEMFVNESMDIVTNLPNKEDLNVQIENANNIDKDQVVSTCEDKINKIKELLKSKCKRNSDSAECNDTKTSPIPIKEVSDEISFGNEIQNNSKDSESSLPENSFDEVTGKFYSSSADSDDSFQIVFTDKRQRIPSECESEDSFIVFEESPDSCYTSNDVFGNENDTDTDSDLEEDSGYGITTCKLNHSLSRTFGDLTDDSLYSADVVDCAVRIGEAADVSDDLDEASAPERTGSLLNEQRKVEKRKQPPKKVHFSPHPPKVHVMRVWAFAARQARAGHWERHALDRERFKRRIADVEMAISWVLKPQHRSRVVFQTFMPWWNAQKRKELAEKKALEEQRLMEEENKSVGDVLEGNGANNNVGEEEQGQRDGAELESAVSGSEIDITQLDSNDRPQNGQLEKDNIQEDMNVEEKDAVIEADALSDKRAMNLTQGNNDVIEENKNTYKIKTKSEKVETFENDISGNIKINGFNNEDGPNIKKCRIVDGLIIGMDTSDVHSGGNVKFNGFISDLEIKRDLNVKKYITQSDT
ncbi:uncharacterized protein LOC119838228 [Zerene cesonia]|uniref:uncharacterized protein LOC119838228 n=1 Tax=Zerene cesonia TaxID=33412 RepID=UPI0018E573C6|nr:uncharacterized protein LOC119838228 [Zerene cesonia]